MFEVSKIKKKENCLTVGEVIDFLQSCPKNAEVYCDLGDGVHLQLEQNKDNPKEYCVEFAESEES